MLNTFLNEDEIIDPLVEMKKAELRAAKLYSLDEYEWIRKTLRGEPGNYELLFFGDDPFYKTQREHLLGLYVGQSGNMGPRIKNHVDNLDDLILPSTINRSQIMVRWVINSKLRTNLETVIITQDSPVWNTITGIGNGRSNGREKKFHAYIDFFHPRGKFAHLPAPCPLSKLEEKLEKVRRGILASGYPVDWKVADILKTVYRSPAGYKAGVDENRKPIIKPYEN